MTTFQKQGSYSNAEDKKRHAIRRCTQLIFPASLTHTSNPKHVVYAQIKSNNKTRDNATQTFRKCGLLWLRYMSLVAKSPYPSVYYKSVISTLPLSLGVMAPLSPLSTPINSNVMLLNEITYMCHFSSAIFII